MLRGSRSNSPGVQPRTIQQQQAQFDELLSALHIPLPLSADEKLTRLRDVPIAKLIDAQETLKLTEFRATTEDAFVSKNLMTNINNGDFGRRMKARGVKLMNGECRDEHASYQGARTPSQSYEAVRTRLIADYPAAVVDTLMQHYCHKSKSLPSKFKDWQHLFGHIYADMQVHNLERGFHNRLQEAGLVMGKDLLRYRFDWRAGCVDSVFPPEQGVTHATDLAIWFWGLDFGSDGQGLSDADKAVLKPWNKAFADFVKGVDPQWGTESVREMKRLRSDGTTDVWLDDRWEAGLQVWNLVNADSGKGLIGWIKARL